MPEIEYQINTEDLHEMQMGIVTKIAVELMGEDVFQERFAKELKARLKNHLPIKETNTRK